MGPFTETAVNLISKEQLAFLKDDEKFISYIVNELSKRLADRIVGILDSEDEIIVKQSDLRVSEYMPTNSVEYRRQISWQPLVRCKDCLNRFYNSGEGGVWWCRVTGNPCAGDAFCSYGERREMEVDQDV